MGALDKLKSRMSGPSKTDLPSETNTQDKQPSAPFNSNDSARMALNSSVNQSRNNIASAGQFVAQEGIGQGIKKLFGNIASKAFGVAGMLLSSQKAYAGPGEDYWRKKQLEKQGYKPLSAEDIKNMDASNFQPTHPPMTDAEFDEYYKDGIPELSLEESNKINDAIKASKENNSTAEK